MILLDTHNLFESGPASVDPGGIDLRHASQPIPGQPGQRLVPQGQSPRTLEQHGSLLGDDIDDLSAQVAAIEALADGQPRTLTDEQGRVWPGVVLLRFIPSPVIRRGRRLALPYRVTYQQLVPIAPGASA